MITVDSNIWIYYMDPTMNEHKHLLDYFEELIKPKQID